LEVLLVGLKGLGGGGLAMIAAGVGDFEAGGVFGGTFLDLFPEGFDGHRVYVCTGSLAINGNVGYTDTHQTIAITF
jgi:hypothetical protein